MKNLKISSQKFTRTSSTGTLQQGVPKATERRLSQEFKRKVFSTVHPRKQQPIQSFVQTPRKSSPNGSGTERSTAINLKKVEARYGQSKSPKRQEEFWCVMNDKDIEIMSAHNSRLAVELECESYKKKLADKDRELKSLQQKMQHSSLSGNEMWDNQQFRTISSFETENSDLRNKLAQLEQITQAKIKKETARLIKLVNESDSMVERLQEELAKVKVRNLELEAEYTDRKNHEQLIKEKDELRIKTQELTKALNRVTHDFVARSDYEDVVDQLNEIQVIKNQLEVENDSLKAELIVQQSSKINKFENAHLYQNANRDIHTLTRQLNTYIDVVRNLKYQGTVNLIELLGTSDLPLSNEQWDSLQDEVDKLKQTFSTFREVNTDFYAQFCSNKCDIQ